MTLKEIRPDSEAVYQDEERLSKSKWVRILGCSSFTFDRAVARAKIAYEIGEPTLKNGAVYKLIPVSEFPRIIEGFKSMKNSHDVRNAPSHPWTSNVNTRSDFGITAPSGSRLQYSYDQK